MKSNKRFFTLLFCVFVSQLTITAQEKNPVNFGKISATDFNVKSPLIDSSTNAVILADQGDLSFEGNNHGWFTYVFKRSCRILFLNTKSTELAKIKLTFYSEDEYKEKLDKLVANTYNLENGNVVSTKLNSDDIFEEKIDKHRKVEKFTMPAVKNGSIIEFSYTIKSDYISFLPEWKFQSQYAPTLWSEYNVSIPAMLSYTSISQTIKDFYINQSGKGFKEYTIRQKKSEGNLLITTEQSFLISAPLAKNRWVKKDEPQFTPERFISTPENFIEKINFQLSSTYDGEAQHSVSDSWKTIVKQLLEREDFGVPLTDNNYWEDNILKDVTDPNDTPEQKARKIYYYIQNNYTCTNEDNPFIKTSLKDVVKNKSGTVGDINLLMISLMKRSGITASPVMLSTTDYGRNSDKSPNVDQLNYVICKATFDNNIFLDGSVPYLPFGKLPARCYNGVAREISVDTLGFDFDADLIKEQDQQNVIIVNTDKGIEGTYTHFEGLYNSIDVRSELAKTGEQNFIKNTKATMPVDFGITNVTLNSVKDIENPVSVSVDFTVPLKDADIVYFNPVITTSFDKNPFPAANRIYDVEMDYPLIQSYNLSMEIPKGYKVDELPKSVKVKLNDTEGTFEYIITNENNTINLFSKTILNKSKFSKEDYNSLREFFAYKLKKEAEQIVFKKMN